MNNKLARKRIKWPNGLPWFMLQWHITVRCDQRCQHCYIPKTQFYKRELENELPLEEVKRVIDSFVDFCRKAGARPGINFTGGDPLLRSDFFEILEYAFWQGIRLAVMGNPFHLDVSTILRLKELDVKSFQLSIDGLKETHDQLRKPGSFDATLAAVRLLKEMDMRTVIMFTLSPKNVSDLLGVMEIASEEKVDVFSFARYVKSPHEKEVDFEPMEYRDILLRVQEKSRVLRSKGSKTRFGRKDHLWKLLFYEQGRWSPNPNPRRQVISGCHVGRSNLTILSDGTVFACRRFESPIGKVPEQSILQVYISQELNSYRILEKFEKCSKCPLLYHCRGCPAVAFGKSGNFYAPDPQCWRMV